MLIEKWEQYSSPTPTMADDHDHHHHHHPIRGSLPPRAVVTPKPDTLSTPTATQSKHRLSVSRSSAGGSSVSYLLLLLFSLRSLYSLLPFLRSSPPFSIFPFTFLVSLLSFLLTLGFSLSLSKNRRPIFSLGFLSLPQRKTTLLIAKALLLAVIFLLRFQALRHCGAAAMILAEVAGNIAARFILEGKDNPSKRWNSFEGFKIRGFIGLFSGLILLSLSWDRVECFPFSHIKNTNIGFLSLPSRNCLKIGSIWLPSLSGFLSYFERVYSNSVEFRVLGQKRVRLITLFFTTILLFIPASVTIFMFRPEGDFISLSLLGWPLANNVIFAVLLSENYTDQKLSSSKVTQKNYFLIFFCTLVLELFYYTELSICGLLICGFSFWVSVRELNYLYTSYPELGYYSSESWIVGLMQPLRHIFSERKSRKIALFLSINTTYMVVEFVVGFMSNSLGLISDGCHMLFDCAALGIGLYASYIARLPANNRFNFGRGRFEVVSGYVNAVFLVLVGAMITLESFERILDPQEVSTSSLLAVSVGGLIVNIVGLIFFHEEHHQAHAGPVPCSHHVKRDSNLFGHEGNSPDQNHHLEISHWCNEDGHDHHHHHFDDTHMDNEEPFLETKKDENKSHHHRHHHHHIDHNMRGIFLHILADTLGSIGVVISTLLIEYKQWFIADPACSIFISALIVSSAIPLLRNSAEVLLHRVPRSREHDIKHAVNDLMKLKGVSGVQNLHVWSLTNTEIIGTISLRVSEGIEEDFIKRRVYEILYDAGIKDLTIQIECTSFI